MIGVLFQCPCGKEYLWRHSFVSHQTWQCMTWRCLWEERQREERKREAREKEEREWEEREREEKVYVAQLAAISEQQQQRNFINEQWKSTSAGGRILAGPDAKYSVHDVKRGRVSALMARIRCLFTPNSAAHKAAETTASQLLSPPISSLPAVFLHPIGRLLLV